jgi:hypothetical protein
MAAQYITASQYENAGSATVLGNRRALPSVPKMVIAFNIA